MNWERRGIGKVESWGKGVMGLEVYGGRVNQEGPHRDCQCRDESRGREKPRGLPGL